MDEGGEVESKVGEVMEGVASIALLPCGSISGHFIKVNDHTNVCYGLHGTDEGGEVESKVGEVMEGVASIALLPCGSISGHFIKVNDHTNVCYGLHGTELACEKECSRGEDYRLIKLAIIDYNKKEEKIVVVECRGHDAARLNSVDHAHGWEKDVVDMVDQQHGKNKIVVSFNCETLKSDKAAEEHISKFLPKLAGLDAVVNIGKMSIAGLDFDAKERAEYVT